jgi:hypothetical protein
MTLLGNRIAPVELDNVSNQTPRATPCNRESHPILVGLRIAPLVSLGFSLDSDPRQDYVPLELCGQLRRTVLGLCH